MRDVKAAGLTLGVLSNMPYDFPRGDVPVFAEADVAVFSCDLGMIKPETGIYEKLRDLAGCAYEEIVFFDDKVDNVAKARELGIQGFLWEGADAARRLISGITGAAI
jgi:putative hydrolase of the HAD superfamily